MDDEARVVAVLDELRSSVRGKTRSERASLVRRHLCMAEALEEDLDVELPRILSALAREVPHPASSFTGWSMRQEVRTQLGSYRDAERTSATTKLQSSVSRARVVASGIAFAFFATASILAAMKQQLCAGVGAGAAVSLAAFSLAMALRRETIVVDETSLRASGRDTLRRSTFSLDDIAYFTVASSEAGTPSRLLVVDRAGESHLLLYGTAASLHAVARRLEDATGLLDDILVRAPELEESHLLDDLDAQQAQPELEV